MREGPAAVGDAVMARGPAAMGDVVVARGLATVGNAVGNIMVVRLTLLALVAVTRPDSVGNVVVALGKTS